MPMTVLHFSSFLENDNTPFLSTNLKCKRTRSSVLRAQVFCGLGIILIDQPKDVLKQVTKEDECKYFVVEESY
jgi:hypothetical protein